MFNSIYKTILDIIFPQKELELEIHNLSEDRLSEKLRINEHSGIVSLFKYKDPLVRQMIWLLKYKRDSHVVKLFAYILYDYLMEEISTDAIFSSGINVVLVPLPLSKKRERERGFNQIKLITDELQKLGDFTIDSDLLIKKKHTQPQTSFKKREDRIENIKGVFEAIAMDSLKNTHVILIDDVLTTGSTLNEARETLEKSGVHKVSCITLAH